MKSMVVAGVFVLGVVLGRAGGQGAKGKPLSGWPGAFPEILGYSQTFMQPVVAPGKDPAAYRQTVRYEWTGGAARRIDVTLARDPAFKERYSAAALTKDPADPAKVQLGKKTGYLWKIAKEGDKEDWPLRERLVVPLAEDRALIIETRGPGPWGPLKNFAERFDLEKIEKALGAPPRTDFRRRIEAFRFLKKGMSYKEVISWVGEADRDVGSGIHIMVYDLDDGTFVGLGFPDFQRLVYAKHQPKDGNVRELAK
jgi:hypothetical protein